jgi:Uma2 family endonuclease
VTARITAAEYIALPDDERWCELIDGAIVVNERRLDNGLVSMQLLVAVQRWINAAPGRGYVVPPVDVDIDEYNVFAPDISWLAYLRSARERLPRIPDLCVEIRSPSTWRYDIGTKLAHYRDDGFGRAVARRHDRRNRSSFSAGRGRAHRISTSPSSLPATTG